MKKLSILMFTAIFLMTSGTLALAKKPVPPADIVDYDIVGFTCPPSVPSTETSQIELRVQVVNVGTSNPGVPLQIREEDAFYGPNILLTDTVVDEIENGNKQRPTEYTYTVSPTINKQWIEFSVNLSDENYTNDTDWAFCQTEIVYP